MSDQPRDPAAERFIAGLNTTASYIAYIKCECGNELILPAGNWEFAFVGRVNFVCKTCGKNHWAVKI